MGSTRVSLILLLAGTLVLAANAVPSSAGQGLPAEQGPLLAPASAWIGTEVQLSPDAMVEADRYRPAVAHNHKHGEYLVVWHNLWPGNSDIYARRVSDSGQVLSWFCVTTGANSLHPDVAYNALDDQYLVVWMQEAAGGVYEIWGKILPWDGPGTNAPFRIIEFPNRSFSTPRVAWNSVQDEYLVVWNAYDTTVSFPPGLPSDIAGSRVQPDGSFWPTPILTTYAYPHQADLVYNVAMDEYLLTFVSVHTQATTGNDIYGLRVGANGYPVDPPGLIPICELAKNQDAPAVATNEQDRYMVVWQHEDSAADRDIYAREYDVAGNPVGSYFTIASWTEDTTAPDVAANGASKEWLAVWQQALGAAGIDYAIKGFRWGGPGLNTRYTDLVRSADWELESPAVAAGIPGYLIAYEGDSWMTLRHIYGRVWWPEAVALPQLFRKVK